MSSCKDILNQCYSRLQNSVLHKQQSPSTLKSTYAYFPKCCVDVAHKSRSCVWVLFGGGRYLWETRRFLSATYPCRLIFEKPVRQRLHHFNYNRQPKCYPHECCLHDRYGRVCRTPMTISITGTNVSQVRTSYRKSCAEPMNDIS